MISVPFSTGFKDHPETLASALTFPFTSGFFLFNDYITIYFIKSSKKIIKSSKKILTCGSETEQNNDLIVPSSS